MTPTQRRSYLAGALAARAYLCRTQADLRVHRQFKPDSLRWALAHTGTHAPEYRAGFVDAIGAFVLMALEGCQVNPHTWDVCAAVERAGERR